MPKSWFSHFYVAGSLVNAWCLLWLSRQPWWECPMSLLAGVLFQAHLARRFLECLFVHTYSADSVMPLSVYLGGIAHYVAAPMSLSAATTACGSTFTTWDDLAECTSRPAVFLGVSCFLAGNVVQNACHLYLASLRAGPARKKSDAVAVGDHYLPTWGPFRYVCCPHYTAEVLIYVGLWLVCGVEAWAALGLAIWTLSNLAVTSRRTLRWYQDSFGAQATAGLKAIVPGVL